MKKLTQDEFITRATKVHNGKYGYSLVTYMGNPFKIKIVCPEHGIFEQEARSHLQGHGCSQCVQNTHSTTDDFIKKSKKIHGDRYNYSKVNYVNNHTKVVLVCPFHGNFEKTPDNHINQKQGCPKCSGKFLDKDFFIVKAKKIHTNKYDYSLVEYKGNNKKVKIICPLHGVFLQTPNNHLSGVECPKCSGHFMDQNFFIEKAGNLHNHFYDYSLVHYSRNSTKVKIICPIHGIFEQTPNMHLLGQGCPKCCSSKGELAVEKVLQNSGVIYLSNFRIKECRSKNPLPFDFAVFEDEEKTKLKCLIEYDGEQHFKLCPNFKMTESSLKEMQKRDKIKTDFCLENKIKLIRISYKEFNDIENILKKELTFN